MSLGKLVIFLISRDILFTYRDAPVDYAFYTKFWSLQEFFREPVLCYTKVSWKKFSTVSFDNW